MAKTTTQSPAKRQKVEQPDDAKPSTGDDQPVKKTVAQKILEAKRAEEAAKKDPPSPSASSASSSSASSSSSSSSDASNGKKKKKGAEVKLDPEVAKKLLAFKEETAKRAHTVITKTMPAKILELSQLVEQAEQLLTEERAQARETEIMAMAEEHRRRVEEHAARKGRLGKRKRADTASEEAQAEEAGETNNDDDDDASDASDYGDVIPFKGTVSSNSQVVALLGLFKEECLSMCQILNVVKLWATQQLPKIEDGNNFGVGVIEEVLGELARAEDSAYTALDSVSRYHLNRGRMVNLYLKNPHVEDYLHAIYEMDEKQVLNVRFGTKDLRNNHAILHDMLAKNMDKLQKPRSDKETYSGIFL